MSRPKNHDFEGLSHRGEHVLPMFIATRGRALSGCWIRFYQNRMYVFVLFLFVMFCYVFFLGGKPRRSEPD